MTMLRTLIGSAVLAGTLSTAYAADDQGFYIASGYGPTQADIKDTAGIVSISKDESDQSFNIYAGYQFNSYLAIEAGYAHLGDYRVIVPAGTTTLQVDTEVHTVFGNIVGKLPITENVYLQAKVGAHHWESEAKLEGAGTTKTKDTDFTGGIGIGYTYEQHHLFSAEWQYFKLKKDDQKTDLNALYLTYAYRF